MIGSHADEVLARADLGDARPVLAENWAEGMGASLRAGLDAVDALDCDGVAVLLADQPRIGAEALRRLGHGLAGRSGRRRRDLRWRQTQPGGPRPPRLGSGQRRGRRRHRRPRLAARASRPGRRGAVRRNRRSCRHRHSVRSRRSPGGAVKLENTFTVPVTADVAWQVLLDVERIAPCMPGATLTGQRRRRLHRERQGQGRPDQPDVRRKGDDHLPGRDEPGRCHRSHRQGDPRNGHGQGGHHRADEGARTARPRWMSRPT